MKQKKEDEKKTLFNIECFFRTLSNYNMVLKLDEIILGIDDSNAEKMARVNKLIEESVEAQKRSDDK
jgi:hypothetical protein